MHWKRIVCLTLVALTLLAPRIGAAQGAYMGPLPAQWVSSSQSDVNAVAYSPNGKLMAAGGYGGIQIITLSSGAISYLPTAATGIYSIAFSPDSTRLAIVGSLIGYGGFTLPVLEVWDLATGVGSSLQSLVGPGIGSFAFSPDGSTFAVGGSTSPSNNVYVGVVQLWNLKTSKLLYALPTACTGVASVAFSPDGTKLADGGWSGSTGAVELWNVSSGHQIASLNTAALSVFFIAFSADSTMLADGGQGTPAIFAGRGGGHDTYRLYNGRMPAARDGRPGS